MREADKLRNTFKKDIKDDRYGEYRKFVYDIKNEYRYIFKDDLKKIEQEKKRLELEIKCKQTPAMGYIMTIISLILGFVLKDVVYNLFMKISYWFAVFGSLAYGLLIVIGFGKIIVENDTKLRCCMFSLEALNELEEEIKLEKSKQDISFVLISKSS